MIHTKPLVIRSLLYSLLLIHIFSFRVYAEIPTTAPQVILLFGTSCAGKSTIGRELQKNLGSCWQILDWDDYANESLILFFCPIGHTRGKKYLLRIFPLE